jgi:hypothetical protein
MNFGLSFSYIFKDKDWFSKLILPAVCMLIPVVGWMVTLGWALKVTRNVLDGKEEPLPNLSFGEDILRGFFAFLISFVYSLPVSIVTSLSGLIESWRFNQNEYTMIGTTLIISILGLVAFLLGIVTALFGTAAIAHYIAKDDIGAAFRFDEVYKVLTTNLGDWIIVALGTMLAVGIIGPLGTIACVIGVFLTLTFGLAVMGNLIGQAYDRSQPKVEIMEPASELES